MKLLTTHQVTEWVLGKETVQTLVLCVNSNTYIINVKVCKYGWMFFILHAKITKWIWANCGTQIVYDLDSHIG